MFKYTIRAYNYDQTVGAVEQMTVIVTAKDEPMALKRAKAIVIRQSYAVTAIEDLRGSAIKKGR